ncbi:unnamed protein product [Cunninghamella echinulata]
MIIKLPLELKREIYFYLGTQDLLTLSYTCQYLRKTILEVIKCKECYCLKTVALCPLDCCDKFYCEDCLPEHFHDYLQHISSPRYLFGFNMITKVKNNIYYYIIDTLYDDNPYYDSNDDDDFEYISCKNERDLKFINFLESYKTDEYSD